MFLLIHRASIFHSNGLRIVLTMQNQILNCSRINVRFASPQQQQATQPMALFAIRETFRLAEIRVQQNPVPILWLKAFLFIAFGIPPQGKTPRHGVSERMASETFSASTLTSKSIPAAGRVSSKGPRAHVETLSCDVAHSSLFVPCC